VAPPPPATRTSPSTAVVAVAVAVASVVEVAAAATEAAASTTAAAATAEAAVAVTRSSRRPPRRRPTGRRRGRGARPPGPGTPPGAVARVAAATAADARGQGAADGGAGCGRRIRGGGACGDPHRPDGRRRRTVRQKRRRPRHRGTHDARRPGAQGGGLRIGDTASAIPTCVVRAGAFRRRDQCPGGTGESVATVPPLRPHTASADGRIMAWQPGGKEHRGAGIRCDI